MTYNKKVLIGCSFLAIVFITFIGGFLTGKLMYKSNKNFNDKETSEIIETINQNYYKDIDEQSFDEFAKTGIISGIDDEYTYFIETSESSDSTYYGLGINVVSTDNGLVVSNVIKDSPAYKHNIKKGDYIISVDGVSQKKGHRALINELKGTKGQNKKITFSRNNNIFIEELTIVEIEYSEIDAKILNSNIGYIRINEFSLSAPEKFINELKKLEEKSITGLIIDVRDNLGGEIDSVNAIVQQFLTGDSVFLQLYNAKENKNYYFRPVLKEKKTYNINVLINENTASAGEIFALSMNRIMNYDLIGQTTFGKGTYQKNFNLEENPNLILHITVGNWYGPNKEDINGKGIDPTYDVKLPDYFYVYPKLSSTYKLDDCNDEIKTIELMLNALGYDNRNDGYFDLTLKNILSENYDSEEINKEVFDKIKVDFNQQMNKGENDTQLNKAIELLK